MTDKNDPISLEIGEAAILFRANGRVVMYVTEDASPQQSDAVLRAAACLEFLQDSVMRAEIYSRVLANNPTIVGRHTSGKSN